MASNKAIFDDEDCDSLAPKTDVLKAQPACLKCGTVQRMMKCCTRCHSAFYCSKTCFAKHWPVHKNSCQPSIRTPEQIQELSGRGAVEDGRTLYRVVQRQKPTAPLLINFQKAADTLSPSTAGNKAQPPPSEDTGSSTVETSPADDTRLPGVEITLRYNKQKHKFKVCDTWDDQTILSKMATSLSCLPDKMRVIHRGKQLSADSLRSAVGPGAIFQVLGEPKEDATGLVPKDIKVLMQQMGVEWNVAVRALRQSAGDLIDAMMAIGNK